jgi:hypothetical protein
LSLFFFQLISYINIIILSHRRHIFRVFYPALTLFLLKRFFILWWRGMSLNQFLSFFIFNWNHNLNNIVVSCCVKTPSSDYLDIMTWTHRIARLFGLQCANKTMLWLLNGGSCVSLVLIIQLGIQKLRRTVFRFDWFITLHWGLSISPWLLSNWMSILETRILIFRLLLRCTSSTSWTRRRHR